ncbi:rluA family pseudouridine synthase [Spirochaetota bacterium]|nr:rluA family pseudouridine synthase [Spirochaetota bacterium]
MNGCGLRYEVELFDALRDIVYEDEYFFVINKAAGLYTHRNHETHDVYAVADVIADKVDFAYDDLKRGIVHRLDKDTSGLLICAKREEVKTALQSLFKKRKIKKIYWALVVGTMYEGTGEVITGIDRDKKNRIKRRVVERGSGKKAHTRYRVLELYKEHTLVEVNILTGRMHQIRLHLNYLGHPVLGDKLYGRSHQKKMSENKLFLLAKQLVFKHPFTNAELDLAIDPPLFFEQKLAELTKNG